METLSPAQDDSSGANPSSVKSEDSSPRHEGGRSSPPPKCAICLGTCRNKSFTDSCLHQFCFKCLLTWSKVKAECPLCKQNFRSIIHNVLSNHQYEEYMVEQSQAEDITERIDIDNLASAARRFRYRTTLTLPRRETLAIQQLLLHYPMMAGVLPPPAHRRRSPASFRRTVYRYNLWARPLSDFTGRFRDCSPEFYRYNDSQIHRLVPWLNRELHYLLNENIGHISYVIARILELLPQYHINSNEFRETMQRYLGERAEHFLHELYCFASTPYDMTGYDRNVQYTTDSRVSTMINEVISSSESEASVDSDIVMISSSEPAEPPPGPSRAPAPCVVPIETISHSDTDDDSSEVMVVGYIKPPQDRTPEVVDLLGSDSDVIVQDAERAATPPAAPPAAPSAAPLVKLTLRHHAPGPARTPSPPRRRRRAEPTADRCASSSSSSSSSSASISSVSMFSPASSVCPVSSVSMFSPTSSSDSAASDRSRASRTRKSRKRIAERNRRKQKKVSHRKSKKSSDTPPGKEKRSKRKSHSGKGVKSSSRPVEVSPPAGGEAPALTSAEQPGPSGAARSNKRKLENNVNRRRLSRDNKRLKSVVNVINSQRNSGESSTSSKGGSSGARAAAGADADDSDSEDDLPLNLSLLRTLNY